MQQWIDAVKTKWKEAKSERHDDAGIYRVLCKEEPPRSLGVVWYIWGETMIMLASSYKSEEEAWRKAAENVARNKWVRVQF